MEFIIFIIIFIIVLYLYCYLLLGKYGYKAIIFLMVFSIILGLLLSNSTEKAGESYPYSEIHLADSNGNVYEIIKMRDGKEVERIVIEQYQNKPIENSTKSY